MPGPAKVKDANGKEFYAVPSSLVHKAIIGLLSLFFSLAGYMVWWAFGDIAWKTEVIKEIAEIKKDDERIERKFEGYPPRWLQNQVNNNTDRIDEIERAHRTRHEVE